MQAPFDRALVRTHLHRARPRFATHSALFDDCAAQLDERLSEVKRDFATSVDLSPFPFLPQAISGAAWDEEFLPLAPNSADLIVSNLGLHWVNDVPGVLVQIKAALAPGGLFLASLIGGESLHELRQSLTEAEITVSGGMSTRFSPTIDLLSASALLQRAGFTLPVADKETLTLIYPHMYALLHELRGMGQTNAHRERPRHFAPRALFMEAARLYHQNFADANGHIPATLDVVFLHGWKEA